MRATRDYAFHQAYLFLKTNSIPSWARPELEETLSIETAEGSSCSSSEQVLAEEKAEQCRSCRNGMRLEPKTAGTPALRILKDEHPMHQNVTALHQPRISCWNCPVHEGMTIPTQIHNPLRTSVKALPSARIGSHEGSVASRRGSSSSRPT
jgi:hypothetical protein